MAGSPIIATISWILLAGGVVFQFFVILGGGVTGNPEPLFYFLKAQTGGIGDAADYSAWAFFAICDIAADSMRYGACRDTKAALPLNPPQNFNVVGDANVPAGFVNTHHYYYLSRFMFAFYIIALFFSCISVLSGFLALCSRIGGYLTGVLVGLAWFFQALAAALMTACYVQGRNAFRAVGRDASVGRYNFGFTWAAFACFFVAMILFCTGGAIGGRSSGGSGRRFGRKKSTRSRGSFRDTEDGGVKDEYS